MKKYSIVKESCSIEDAHIQDKDIIYILLKENFNNESEHKTSHQNTNKSSNITHNLSSAKKKSKKIKSFSHSLSLEHEDMTTANKEFAPIDKIPILTKPGYKSEPDYREIVRMSLEELQNVKDFAIYNDYGKIKFPGSTNLEGLNIDDIVNIEDKLVSLYQINDQVEKHPQGEGLNKEAVITLYNMKPSQSKNEDLSKTNFLNETINDNFESLLKKECDKKGMTFIKYDRITGNWTFKVSNFK